MPEFLPGAVFSGISTILFVIVLRARAGMPRLPAWKLGLIGIAGGFAIPWTLVILAKAWRATPGLPELPFISSDQVFIGTLVALFVLAISHRPGRRPRVPLWGGLLAGITIAAALPPFLFHVTGSYQRASLRPDVNQCTRGMLGEVQPREITNICGEPITVGLCLSGEVNPAPCTQTKTIPPGESAQFDPGDARLSSLPSNLDGLTVVACRPPGRPSRMLSTIGRKYEGVCLPPAITLAARAYTSGRIQIHAAIAASTIAVLTFDTSGAPDSANSTAPSVMPMAAAVLPLREMARFSRHSMIWGPKRGSPIKRASSAGEDRAKQPAAMIMKIVVGSSGTKRPTAPMPASRKPADAKACRFHFGVTWAPWPSFCGSLDAFIRRYRYGTVTPLQETPPKVDGGGTVSPDANGADVIESQIMKFDAVHRKAGK